MDAPLLPSTIITSHRSRRQQPHITVTQDIQDPPRVSVVIPALNEAKNLPHVLPRIPTWVHEVILIPGHSTDDTVKVARELWPSIRVVAQERRGKGAALQSGFAAATGDIIVMLDADGSMDPKEIPAFIKPLQQGADFAKGSRFVEGGGTVDMEFYRKFGNWGLLMAVRVLFGGRYSDLCYGYNAFWKHVLPKLNLDGDGFEIETMMNVRALRAGLEIVEVPSFEAERIHGVSNLHSIRDGLRILKTIVKERIKQSHPMPSQAADATGHALVEQMAPQVPLLTIEMVSTAEMERAVGVAQ